MKIEEAFAAQELFDILMSQKVEPRGTQSMRKLGQKRNPSEALFEAVATGDAEQVRKLVAVGADHNYIEEVGDVTALMIAAEKGRLDVVEVLVSAGADVNAIAEDPSGDLDQFPYLDDLFARAKLLGMFPLAYAAVYGQDAVYDYLLPLTKPALRRQAEAIRQAREKLLTESPTGTAKKRTASAKARAGEELLRRNPKLARWINECVLCGRKGTKPEMPERIDRDGSADLLRQHFKPLALVDLWCDKCQEKIARGRQAIQERSEARAKKRATGTDS